MDLRVIILKARGRNYSLGIKIILAAASLKHSF